MGVGGGASTTQWNLNLMLWQLTEVGRVKEGVYSEGKTSPHAKHVSGLPMLNDLYKQS